MRAYTGSHIQSATTPCPSTTLLPLRMADINERNRHTFTALAGEPHYLSNHRVHRQTLRNPNPPKTRHTSEVAYAQNHITHKTRSHRWRLAPAFMRNDCRCRASFPRDGVAYAYIAYAKEQSHRRVQPCKFPQNSLA